MRKLNPKEIKIKNKPWMTPRIGCGIFIGLRKAFDTVNHEILLMKLHHYGIRNNMLSWFKSYLTDRKQYHSMGKIRKCWK